jgi:hypothetical protein
MTIKRIMNSMPGFFTSKSLYLKLPTKYENGGMDIMEGIGGIKKYSARYDIFSEKGYDWRKDDKNIQVIIS